MRYYGKKSLASFLKIILDVLLAIGIICIIYLAKNMFTIKNSNINLEKKIIMCSLFLIGGICLVFIVYNLRKIMNSVVDINPFIRQNVVSLFRISKCCFIISGCYLVNFFVNSKFKEYKFIFIDNKGIHSDFNFLIFFFIGCFVLILGKVFKKAVDVKEENDLTI